MGENPSNKIKGLWSSKKMLVTSLIFFTICLLWLFVASDLLPRYNKEFSYSADIISVDNFFDEQANDFTGYQYSNTKFGYKVVNEDDFRLTIENSFDVSTLDGAPIFSVLRTYGVNAFTGNIFKIGAIKIVRATYLRQKT